MNLKKLLAAVGLLTVSVPATLSVVACGNKQTDKKSDTNSDEIIKSINKLTNLEINITSKEEGKAKVLDLLKDPNIGLATIIAKHNEIKDFKKDLFKLDSVAKDAKGQDKIKADETISSNETYYFNYTYNGKANNAFIAVKIVNTEKMVTEGINKTEFKTSAVAGSKAEDFIKTINKEFIEKQLTPDLQKILSKTKIYLEITSVNNEAGQKLSDADLETVGTVKAKIAYKYATTEGQTNLTITVTQNETDQKIAKAISETSYKKSIESNSKVADLRIDSTFIKKALSPNLQKEFKIESFTVTKITKENGFDLIDNDLITSRIINAQIHYNYGTIKNQKTNLEITVTVSKEEIIDELRNAEYALEFKGSTTLEEIKNKLTSEFIKNSLKPNVKAKFEDDKFTVIEVINSENKDLTIPGTFKLQFNFTYDGEVINANSNLTITITEDVEKTQTDIANAISTANYETSITSKSTVEQLRNQITEDLIKEKLTPELQEKFDYSKFELKTITKDGTDLNESILANSGIINAQINFDYGVAKNKTTNLTIKVTVSQAEVNEVIKTTTFSKDIQSYTKISDLKNQINTKFIKSQLTNADIKGAFKSFELKDITNNGNSLKDETLQKSGTINAKISYNYGEFKDQKTNLTINITVSNTEIAEAISQTTDFKLQITTNNVEDLKNQITGNFIKEKLTSELKKAFDSNSFYVINISNSDDTDLTTKHLDELLEGTIPSITVKISFIYAGINNTTNLLLVAVGHIVIL